MSAFACTPCECGGHPECPNCGGHEVATQFWLHKHEISQQYGGPEEGGWWFEVGRPVSEWEPLPFYDEERAYECCRTLNAEERERAKREEQYEYTSVLSYMSTHYAYSVSESPQPVAYPESRPHYE
jgi:hypothetical protein